MQRASREVLLDLPEYCGTEAVMDSTQVIATTVLLAMNLSGLVRASVQFENTEAYTDEDHTIVAVALEGLCNKRDTDSVLVADRTSMNLPPGVAGAAQTRHEAAAFFQDIPEELRDNFSARKRRSVKLEKGRIKAPIRIILSSEEEVTTLLKATDGWSALPRKYSKARDIFVVLRPGISPDHHYAVLYVGHSCGPLCGEGRISCLARRTASGKS
jgi:hypothetical protein